MENHTINIASRPPPPPPKLPDPKLPKAELVQGTSREDYIKFGIPLYKAALKGDWKAAKPILDERPELVRYAITDNMETLLHVAASAEWPKRVENFVKSLVLVMDIADLEIQNKSHNTALSLAAQAGNMEIAKTMVNKNPRLVDIPNNKGLMPLYMAALFAKAEMVRYLYGISKNMLGDFWTDKYRGLVLHKCVESEIFDVAIRIVKDHPQLLDKKRLLTDVLLALAQKTKAFEGKKTYNVFRIIKSFIARVMIGPIEKEGEALLLLRIIWGRIAKMSKEDIDSIVQGPNVVVKRKIKENESEALPYLKRILELMDTRLMSETNKETEVKAICNVLFVATKKGNIRFITELISLYPDLIWKIDFKGKTIFHLAIKHRQANIYNLLYEFGSMKELIIPVKDREGNNMLHMVSTSSKQCRFQDVSGVAFQMQRVLLWFKEVEQMMPTKYRTKKNIYGETPRELFTRKHADLVIRGEQWMKDTSSQCIVVATLIATIVFAAAFTLPGGYNQNTGIPFFHKEPSLVIFVISDAISLISSSTSVLIFLSILTSRYAENDFLDSLPKKLLSGVATLFLSIITMMVTFSASFFVLYNNKVEWVPITITGLASMPVILFAGSQFPLLRDVFNSTYQSRYLFNPKKHILYR